VTWREIDRDLGRKETAVHSHHYPFGKVVFFSLTWWSIDGTMKAWWQIPWKTIRSRAAGIR
jgi:hypothetical protein